MKTSAQLELEIGEILAAAEPAKRKRAGDDLRAALANYDRHEPEPLRTTNRMRLEIAYPAELTQANQHFASGVNAPGELEGLARSARNFGITATEVRPPLLEMLERLSFNGGPKLFVDSGAFSEVKFHKDGPPTVSKAITDAEWKKRLDLYEWCAMTYGPRCYLVAPDRVGDQQVTLDRLAKYGARIAACAARRANIIVPIQKGKLPMSVFAVRALGILGLRERPIIGVPMKKDATSNAQLTELVDSLPWYDVRIHLLGIGPESPRFAKAIEIIKGLRPNAAITSDSVTIRRLVGRSNGRGGGPRALTKYQDEARAGGERDPQRVKAHGLMRQGADEYELERQAAIAAGWRDTELD